ncbi:MAG: pyridine nucleotide-disulfide oxidoreductase [Candidatus Omnitrophica bacterium]|nr:pyridine nucleotide-disulfide oxidoreductase [Candidatus Omnitrophota bacterium]
MKEKTDILILGAGPAGMISALTALKYYPDKQITVLKSVAKGVVPCGIPYMFSSLTDPEDNELDTTGLEKKRVRVHIDEAVTLERAKKTVLTLSGKEYSYEKLIVAVGSKPIVPPIPGIDKEGIYPILKDMEYLKQMVEKVRSGGNVLVIGGGFIGVEFADEVSKIPSCKVRLVEILPRLLSRSFDPEFSCEVEEKLRSRGVEVLTGRKVTAFLGDKKVTGARFENGEEFAADRVILGIGAVPNTELASLGGIELRKATGGIWVDEYMRTSDSDIFAVGDCAGKRDFYTHKDTSVMLASTATAEARIAGANLYSLKVVRENKGTIAVYSTYVDGLVLGSAGLTGYSADKEGFETITGSAEGMDKHPGKLPGSGKLKVKLIFSKQSGTLMGGQVSGGISAGEMINIIGMAIQQRVSVSELETLQMATHPFLTAAPTKYGIVVAAQDALSKMR